MLQACDVRSSSSLFKKELQFLLIIREMGRAMHPVKPRDGAQHLTAFRNCIAGLVLGFQCFVSSVAVLGGLVANVGS